MSESYEGVVLRATLDQARDAFRTCTPSFPVQAVVLAEGIFGAYRCDGREPFDTSALHRYARSLSEGVDGTLAVSYDNRCGIRGSALFRGGRPCGEFGERDEEWVPLDQDGMPIKDGPRLTADQLSEDEEYDCLRDAIRLGLEALGIRAAVDADDLKDAFCYERRPKLEDHT